MENLIFNNSDVNIEKYIRENFNEFSVADLFEIINRNINFSLDLFKDNVELLKDKKILNYIFENFDNIPEFITDELYNNDYEITFMDVKKYNSIRNNKKLLYLAYQKDPRVVLLFPQDFILYTIVRDAIKKGVYATEEDILFNPVLADMEPLMEVSIKHNPKLIKYVTFLCGIQLSDEVIEKALTLYKITEKDLLENPSLCGIFNIISKLPEYRLYSTFLSDDEKISEIGELLKKQDYNKIAELPFFKKEFNSKVSPDNIKYFSELLFKTINEDELFEQKKYKRILDHILSGTLINKYYDSKPKFIYPDTVSIVNDIKVAFYEAKKNNSDLPLNNIANKFKSFVNLNNYSKELISYDQLLNRLNDLYEDYLKENININDIKTTLFCNELLNIHRNSFLSIEKNKILNSIKNELPLSKKRIETLENGEKLVNITYLIATRNYKSIGTSRDKIMSRLLEIKNDISNNKDVLNSYGVISDQVFDYFSTLFLNSGQVDYLTIAHILGTTDNDLIHYIFKKYEQIKVELLNNIQLEKDKFHINQNIKNRISLNAINFKYASNDIYLKNIAKLLLNSSDEDIELIQKNDSNMDEILNIITFMDIVPDLNSDLILKILRNFTKIKGKIVGENYKNVSDLTILSKFYDVIGLAKGYDVINNLYTAILGNEILEKIGVKDIKDYYNFYFKMRNKIACSIPKVKGEFGDFIYESNNFNDIERLLIGKMFCYSCIDLNNTAGHDTFVECLAGTNSDVIMIRDKNTKKLVARALIFRRGNIVQIANIHCCDGATMYCPDEFFEVIADQIIGEAIKRDDNIDYVFVTEDAFDEPKFEQFENILFETAFPHADLWKTAYLIRKNPQVENIDVNSNLDFFCNPKCLYERKRSLITTEINSSNLTRLKALKIALEPNEELRKTMEDNFEPFYADDYISVITGEDWYIALRRDGESEELILPSSDPRTVFEFENAKNSILNLSVENKAKKL